MTYQIIVKYKNGTTLFIDVPENYYQNKYTKKPDAKLHKIFMKEYKKFSSSLKSGQSIINVGKYLGFSNAIITTKDILGIDLKPISKDQIEIINNTHGAYDKVYLDIKNTLLNDFIKYLVDLKEDKFLIDLVKKLDFTLDKFNELIKFYIESKTQPQKQTKRKNTVEKESSKIQIEDNVKESTPYVEKEVKL